MSNFELLDALKLTTVIRKALNAYPLTKHPSQLNRFFTEKSFGPVGNGNTIPRYCNSKTTHSTDSTIQTLNSKYCAWKIMYTTRDGTFLNLGCNSSGMVTSVVLWSGPGSSVGIATELRTIRSGIESRWGRDFPPLQTGTGAHPASCKMGTGSFPEVKCGRGVTLTTQPLLVLRSWKSRTIPLPTLWATQRL